MVRHINAQQLLIICGTMVWHSPVLKVLIHLFELTSCMVQHSMVSYIKNKNVFMVKLSNFSWQTHVNVHIRVQFVHGCHIQGYTWVIHVHLITRCYASCVRYIFQVHLIMLCVDTLLIRIFLRWPDKMPKVKPGQSRKGKNKATKTTTQRDQSS